MWIPALASVVAGWWGQKQSNKEAAKLRKSQQPLIDSQTENQQLLKQWAQGLFPQGQQNLNLVQSYLRPQVTGDRNATLSALAPEINALTQRQQGSVQAQRGMFPRGGPTASAAAQQPYQFQGDLNNLLFSARPMAAQQLGQLGSNQASMGLSALGQGAGLTNSMLGYGLDAQRQVFGQGMQLGQGVSSMIAPFLQYYMMNRQAPATPTIQNSGGGYSGPGLFGRGGTSEASFPQYNMGNSYSAYQPSTPSTYSKPAPNFP